MREVAIIGIGDTKFGELWDLSFREMGIQAGLAAVARRQLWPARRSTPCTSATCPPGTLHRAGARGALIADYSGLARDHIPATRVEAAGASGGLALRQGYLAVASGMHDMVVVGGAEKMTDVGRHASPPRSSPPQRTSSGRVTFGATFPSLHAMIARRHMYEYGTTREQMASVAVKNHLHGSLNPKAQFQKEIDLDDGAASSPPVAEPLGMFDCAPSSDGAAAVVLCALEKARKYTDTPIKILASAQASDTLALHARADIIPVRGHHGRGAQRAFKQAGLGSAGHPAGRGA